MKFYFNQIFIWKNEKNCIKNIYLKFINCYIILFFHKFHDAIKFICRPLNGVQSQPICDTREVPYFC